MEPAKKLTLLALLATLLLVGSGSASAGAGQQIAEAAGSASGAEEHVHGLYPIVSNDLLAPYTPDYRTFRGVRISDKIVYFRQRTIGQAIVEKDYVVYHFNRDTRRLLDTKTHWREDLPTQLPELASEEHAESMVDGDIRFRKLFYISPDSDVLPIKPAPKNPCWVIESINGGEITVTVIDAVDGRVVGHGIPPPYTAFALTGPTSSTNCTGGWYSWYQNARDWFNAMGYDTQMQKWPSKAMVKSHIQSHKTAMFYEAAHGGSTSFLSACNVNITSSDIEAWIADFHKMPFAFIASCDGLCWTTDNTFSYELRKGSDDDTATVGYCGMSGSPCTDDCWYAGYTIDWQTTLFEYMSQGWTVKAAFDQANAEYPGCALNGCMRFAGDESFTVVPVVSRREGPPLCWFVDVDANGANNGSSWADAFNNLQDALVASSGADEIRVAEGIYRPDEGAWMTPGDRAATFQPFAAISIVGGYAGFSEPDPNAWDISKYKTVLSGDLNGDDGPDFTNNAENSYHVVTISGTGTTTTLEGFTITGGNANGSLDINRSGAGIYNRSASSTLINCTITGNSAYRYGGGMYNENGSPTLAGCVFNNNSAQIGGGMQNDFDSKPVLTNCTFSGNAAESKAGGIGNYESVPRLTNCILWGNYSGGSTDESAQIEFSGDGVPSISYSCIQGWIGTLGGVGNMGDDPLLASDGYHLHHSSPCVNAGDPNFSDSWQTDIDGQPRLIGGRVDMGADEFDLSEPIIEVLPKRFDFVYGIGGDRPEPGALYVRNWGAGTLHWEIIHDCNWLYVAPTWGQSSGEADEVLVSVNVEAVESGKHSCMLMISDPSAVNSPLYVPVSLDVGRPIIEVAPEELDFSCSLGGPSPEPQKVRIWNGSLGTLNWQITEDCDWLEVWPTHGRSCGEVNEVTVSVDANGLRGGKYTCNVMISDPNAAETPQYVTVNLEVLGPAIAVTPEMLYVSCPIRGPEPEPQTLSIRNGNIGTLNWLIAEDCHWLDVFPTSGSSTGEVNEVTITFDVSILPRGYYVCGLTISDDAASNSPVLVPVTLVVHPRGEIHVPTDFSGIQAAIDAATDGYRVVVWPGVYYGNIDLGGKNIVVTSIDPNDPAVVADTNIIGEESGNLAVKISKGSVLGFTVTGGISIDNDSAGSDCSALISHCNITSEGTAIQVSDWTSPIIENNIISGSSAGVYFWRNRGVHTTIRNNVIIGESPDAGCGILYRTHDELPVITANIITNWKDGIHFTYDSLLEERKALIKYNNVWGNARNYWIDEYRSAFDMTGICGNMSQDPRFVDSINGDYHLRSESACIDAGDPQAQFEGQTDIDGEPRVMGGRVDIGPDEFAYKPEYLQRLEITGPEPMRENSSAQYTATAQDEHGRRINVSGSVTWLLTPDEYGSFDDHGRLTLPRMETLSQFTIIAEYQAADVSLQADMLVHVSVPSSLQITGATKLGDEVCEQYTATAHYPDGSAITVTDLTVWSIEPEGCGSFDGAGRLTTGRINTCDDITIRGEYTVAGVTVEGQMPAHVSLPISLEITGLQDVLDNSEAQYKAVAYYDNGLTKDVTELAEWRVTPESVADVEAGLLRTNDLDETQTISIYSRYVHCEESVEAEITVTVHAVDRLYVPADYTTIQEAVDAAKAYDVVVVADGVYTGEGNRDVDFIGKAITVCSENGPDSCIIDCNGMLAEPHRGFCFYSGEGRNSVLDGFTITNGYAYGTSLDRPGGGAIRCDGSSPTIANCTLIANCAVWDGGAVNIYNGNPTIVNCAFIENRAIHNDGGAINNDGSSPTIVNCTFVGNSAYDWGGAMRILYEGSPTIINCVFQGNSSTGDGGGIFIYEADATFINCTFAGNSAPGGGGIDGGIDSRATIVNCIVWGNTSPQLSGDEYEVRYSNIEGGWPGSGNLITDPCFSSPGYWLDPDTPDDPADDIWIDGDYRLLPGSPCIDSGDNSAVPADSTDLDQDGNVTEPIPLDLDGDPRFSDDPDVPDRGSGTGPIVDMGAYEGWKEASLILLSTDAVIVPEGDANAFTVALSRDPADTVEVTVVHLLGDQDITVESGASLIFDSANYSQPQTVTLAAAEDYDFLEGKAYILIGAAGFVPAVVTATEVENEYVPHVMYVDANAPPDNNGVSWLNAYDDLQKAIEMAAALPDIVREIRVAQGIYTPAEPFSEDRYATFHLVNGVAIKGGYAGFGAPDGDTRDVEKYETILSGDLHRNDLDVNDPCDLLTEPTRQDNAYHVVNGTGCDRTALLEGFAITGGDANGPSYYNKRGGGLYGGSPTISRCKIFGNAAEYYGGGASLSGYDYDGGAIIMYSTITSNAAQSDAGISGCGELVNCVVSGNVATKYGGGALGAHDVNVVDCVFSRNTAKGNGGVVSAYNDSPRFTHCSFIGNSANGSGGVLCIDGCPSCSDSYPEFHHCTFIANSAQGYGGAVCSTSNTFITFDHCIIAGNTAGCAGGALYDTSYYGSTLVNCTVTGNVVRPGTFDDGYTGTGGTDGTYYVWPERIPFVTNCIFWDNYGSGSPYEPPLTYGYTHNNGVSFINYCCIQGWTDSLGGIGNFDVDPCFVSPGYWANAKDANFLAEPNDPNAVWIDGDYHLKSQAGRWDSENEMWLADEVTSPCIDAGDPTSDWSGELWPHGKCINMGAYGGTAEASMSLSYAGNAADLNGDDIVNLQEFAALAHRWLTGDKLLAEDFNRDGLVDIFDLKVFADNWLWCER